MYKSSLPFVAFYNKLTMSDWSNPLCAGDPKINYVSYMFVRNLVDIFVDLQVCYLGSALALL